MHCTVWKGKMLFLVPTCLMDIFLKCNTVSYFWAYIFNNDVIGPHFHPTISKGQKKIRNILVTNFVLLMGYSRTCLWNAVDSMIQKNCFGEDLQNHCCKYYSTFLHLIHWLLVRSLFVNAPPWQSETCTSSWSWFLEHALKK